MKIINRITLVIAFSGLAIGCGEGINVEEQLKAIAAADHGSAVEAITIVPSDTATVEGESLPGKWLLADGYLRYYVMVEQDTGELHAVDHTNYLAKNDVAPELQQEWLVSVHKDVDFAAVPCPYLRCESAKAGLFSDETVECAAMSATRKIAI